MPRTHDDIELDELIRRLKKLKAKFPEEGSSAAAGEGGDGFAELEETFLRRVANATELLKSMTASSDTVSITEQIRARTNAHNEITAIAETVRKMSELIQKERKHKAKNKGKISDEELVRRELNMNTFTIKLNQLAQQLSQGRQGNREDLFGSYVPKTTLGRDQIFGTGAAGDGGNIGAAAARSAGVGYVEPAGGASLSAEQQQSLAEIYRRDEEQDKMIEEIGELIQETGQLAQQINETVIMQKAMLDDVEKNVDQAQDKLISVNTKLKRTLEAKGMSWERMCMIFLCMALILGLVGVVIPKGSNNG